MLGTLNRDAIAALIPHQGAMCLLSTVERYDERTIVCHATSHASEGNPLRIGGRLPALAGIEYGAQALAVHCALINGDAAGNRARGVLAGARDVALNVDRLDDVPGPLTVRAERLVSVPPRLLYGFVIEDEGRELVSGRVAVVLSSRDEP
jgi:predicted hotdog family 3-hydroxylacyl-ACP dehydratase